MCDSLTPGAPDSDTAQSLNQTARLMPEAALLQRDLRNMLTPALLSADRLLTHTDPVVARQAEIVIKAIARVIDRVR